MKLLLSLVVLISFALFSEAVIFQGKDEISQSLAAYEEFIRTTPGNDTLEKARDYGCCPVIVRNCIDDKVGTVIQPFTGWRANVAAIIDWGCTDHTPCPPCDGPPGSRPCTPDDKGFVWYVSWGDTKSDSGYKEDLGPIQVVHQYPHSDRTYRVTLYYCSNPTTDPRDNCCDSIYRYIAVSEDPCQCSVNFNEPLKKTL